MALSKGMLIDMIRLTGESAGQTNINPLLSKSKFVQGLLCHKALYLQMHHPELADPVPASREALVQTGNEVGALAHGLFPGEPPRILRPRYPGHGEDTGEVESNSRRGKNYRIKPGGNQADN